MNSVQTISIDAVLNFIIQYRKLEEAPLTVGYAFIKDTIAPKDSALLNHLSGHWKSKDKKFDAFFTNLSRRNQIKILHKWNIVDPADEKYLAIDEHEDPEEFLFGEPPATVNILHKLLVFFYNHSVSNRPAEGIELTVKEEQYGNSTNWGNYILKSANPRGVLKIIVSHIV